ncbi:MAG: nucleotidyltransferase domain-containing protein [Firmicutes bacterium]|nr:nucleotidyltransferase domain-containing protein [Bacillota bacterium]
MISEEQIREIVERIVVGVDPDRVILFGSYAYGEPDEDSDLDLLVIKETSIPRYKRGREVRKHLRGMKIPIDIVVYTEDEIQEFYGVKTSFIAQITEEGRVLYERCRGQGYTSRRMDEKGR